MKGKKLIMLSVVTLLVIALGASATAAAAQTSVTSTAAQAPSNTFFIPLVDRNSSAASSTTSSSSSATTSTSTSTSGTGISASSPYAPQPGDSLLQRDKVFIDFSQSKLIATSTLPTKVDAYLVGALPDPCHLLRITEASSTASNIINIQVYSLFDPSTACITVLKPFAVTYPLGTFSNGQYTVYVNGTRLGTFGTSTSAITSVTK